MTEKVKPSGAPSASLCYAISDGCYQMTIFAVRYKVQVIEQYRNQSPSEVTTQFVRFLDEPRWPIELSEALMLGAEFEFA